MCMGVKRDTSPVRKLAGRGGDLSEERVPCSTDALKKSKSGVWLMLC